MGAACSASEGGSAYAATDPAAKLSPAEMHALVLEKLKSTIFSGLMTVEQMSDFAHFFTIRNFPENVCFIKKNTNIDSFFIVAEGSITMSLEDTLLPAGGNSKAANAASPKGQVAKKGQVVDTKATNQAFVKKAGEYLGESLFNSSPVPLKHEYNYFTVEYSMLLVLTKNNYVKYISKYPNMQETVTSLALSMETQLKQLEFFQGVDPQKMKMLVTMFKFVPLMNGAVLFHENDFDRELGNSLFFLYKGKVKVTNSENVKNKDGSKSDEVEEKLLNTLEPGCFFGEVGLMMDIPRTATITAVESTLLLELTQKKFRDFIVFVPEMLTKFNSVLLEYNIHLRYFICNPIFLKSFEKYCSTEFSTENIEFWVACRDYHKLEKQEDLEAKAKHIKSTYVGNSAPSQVNLKGSVEAKLLKGLKEVPLSNTVFLEAEEEILQLMSSDSFPRFKASELFKKCIEEVNNPITEILRRLYLI